MPPPEGVHGQPSRLGRSQPPPATRQAASGQVSPAFRRLWTAFMSARIVIALALLGLHLGLHLMGQALTTWQLGWCLAFVALTTAARLTLKPRGPGRAFDAQWLPTVGLDLLFFAVLQAVLSPGVNYTPLLALPVVMAAILGSRVGALGTAALTALMLLGYAAWTASTGDGFNSTATAQAGLTGAGLLLLALLTNQLASRLVHEETVARRSRLEAQVQSAVNSMVIEALPDGVLVVDTAHRVRAANPAALVMLGADEDAAPPLFSLDDNPAWLQLTHLVRLALAGTPADTAEVVLHHEDRMPSRLQVRTQRTPPIGAGGPSLCVVFLQDLRELEAQLRTEKLASMGRMSAAVAHEIRNPLAAISQANALLAEDLDSPLQRRLTDMVQQNAQRLQHIVEDVLDVARAQGQGDPTQTHALALDETTRDFCDEWAQQHQVGQRLRLELHAPDVFVQFASDHLRRMLVNLLDNAARYATHAEGAIQVATHAVRHGPVMLMVWSDGAAMEPAVRRHLFEPFFSSESRSSGLGLFICRELCERHGATIAYERTAREQAGRIVEGNEFFVSFRRTHSGHSTLILEDTELP